RQHGENCENNRNADTARAAGERDWSKLKGKGAGLAETRDRVPLGLDAVANGSRRDGFVQVVFDLLHDAARQRAVKAQRAGELFEIGIDHAGFPEGAPLSRPAMASENCRQTARLSASARLPCRVSA